MSRYVEFRIARRFGEIIHQRRYVTYKVTESPWWKPFSLDEDVQTTYGKWEDIPIPEIGEEENRRWDSCGIQWPLVGEPILSEKDK